MSYPRVSAFIIGVFYIIAAVSSIVAVILYQPVLSADWLLVTQNGHQQSLLFGVFNDLLLVVSAVGTAVMFFPFLRKVNETIALFHLCFRFMEAVLISTGLIAILALIQISVGFDQGLIQNTEAVKATGVALQAFHRWTFLLGPNFMLGINTAMYSFLLIVSGLVPKNLARFGFTTALLVFFAGQLDFWGIIGPASAIKGILALPVGIFELSLAAYLMTKGFRSDGLKAINN